jgi:outer membrane protein TolC
MLSQQLRIVRELESIQKNKADLERTKYNNGRSTTYQALTFEQDYINSRIQRISLELQLRKFINSLELYK